MTPPEGELSLHERIRNRRTSMGLAGYELAERAGISPSYLSLIESGAKVPSEEIALAIARALDDNPDLYLAWAHAGRLRDVPAHMARLGMLQRLTSRADSRRRVRSGEDLLDEDELAARGPVERASARSRRWKARVAAPVLDAVFGRASPRETLEVPLLAEGSDPADDPAVLETLRIDPRLLPPDVERPFAYRPGPAAIAGLEDALGPGDLVLLTSRVDLPLAPAIYAVRSKDGMVLARVIHHENVLLALSPDPQEQPTAYDVSVHRELQRRLAGRVVATLRTWPVPSGPRSRSPAQESWRARPRGRSVQVEGDFLVRDCEWRDGYGWRPIQRPEDLDWLEAHPGTKIRFRLMRNGRVRYLLEMTPAEWREALGDYVEGDTWRTNGYIVAITKRSVGEYGEDFQDRWAPYVRKAGPGRQS